MEAEKRTCKYCNRSFANGKSLGGHMKLHLSLACAKGTPGAGTSSPQKKRKTPSPSATGGDPGFTCQNCGKGYSCWSSYWRHIRWHQLVEKSSNDSINIEENASEEAQIEHAAHMLVALSKMDCACYDLSNNFVPVEEKCGLEEMQEKLDCAVCYEDVPPDPCGSRETRAVEEQHVIGFDLNAPAPEVTGEYSVLELLKDEPKDAIN